MFKTVTPAAHVPQKPLEVHTDTHFTMDTLRVLLLAGLFWSVFNTVRFTGFAAEMAQVHADLANLTPATAPHVIGQVVEINRTIRRNQALSHDWLCGWFYPMGWRQLQPLPLPEYRRTFAVDSPPTQTGVP